MPSKELCEKCLNKACFCKDCRKVKRRCEEELGKDVADSCSFRECDCDSEKCFRGVQKERG